MVQVPAEVPTTPNDAPGDAQPRADSERMLGFIDALLRANGETAIRQADDNAKLVNRIVDVERDNARLQTERDNALVRAAEANEELSHLRIDLRRAARQEEQAKRVADAQEARADALESDLAEARQKLHEAEAEAAAERAKSWWDKLRGR